MALHPGNCGCAAAGRQQGPCPVKLRLRRACDFEKRLVDAVPDSSLFLHSDSLGRKVRTGSWQDQSVGTYTKLSACIASREASTAISYVEFFLQEAKVIYALYTQINPDLRAFMHSRGMSAAEVSDADRNVVDLLRLPSGEPFDRDALMSDVEQHARLCSDAIDADQWAAADENAEAMRETWRRVKDRDGDHSYGLIDAIVKRFGEGVIGDMWDSVIRPLFNWRYANFDIAKRPWDESLDQLMMVACESMRSHLVGVERTGDFELVELDDRFILRFDPCGSGGRIVRGDLVEGTPSRMEDPYNWGVSEEPHSWNHGKSGICHYCTHCIRLMEEMPIDRFGYPLRVVDPPVYPDADPLNRQYCQWQMFKDPTAVPVEFYSRVDRVKPEVFGSNGVPYADEGPATFFGKG